jgi:hypothetical protein
MAILRRNFFDTVRTRLFAGRMAQKQVEGIAGLLDEGEARGLDTRWIAYVLATAYHETDRTMQPIREYGLGAKYPYGRPDPETGHTYYGRGYVQLTWKANYKKLGDKLGVDLVADPDKAMDPKVAVQITYLGMIEGLFTGDKLANHFRSDIKSDWLGARRIINGMDRASVIAGYAIEFNAACVDPFNVAPAIS